jgi:hypothetical protein
MQLDRYSVSIPPQCPGSAREPAVDEGGHRISLCHDDRVLLPVEWVPATVPAADADLLVREGLFLGIRAVTAFPTGAAFRLVIRVRDENVIDGVDYRAICGHSLRGSPPLLTVWLCARKPRLRGP